MKTQTVNALSYSFNLLSFIFQIAEAGQKIPRIFLFGSAIRGELGKESDIDLFVECVKKDEGRVKQLVDSGIVKFTSSQDYRKWKLLHFTYPFSVQIGTLAEWDLQLSIASEGLLLYSKKSVLTEGKRMVLFVITYPVLKKKYVGIRRLLFGRDEEFYQGTGLVQELRGEKISSHVILIPVEERTRLVDVLTKENIDFRMKEVTILEG